MTFLLSLLKAIVPLSFQSVYFPMRLNNKQIQNFISRIKLSQSQKESYGQQIDSLKEKVVHAINEMDSAKVQTVRRAGSWKKGTALAPRYGISLDVDLVFFIKVDEGERFDAEKLRKQIIDVLCKAYPNKERKDFEDGKKTVGVVFRGTGLEVDVIPFIPDSGNSIYGQQPRKTLNSGEFRTSVAKQLDFNSRIKEKCSSFSSIVRILKHWRNFQEIELSSFSIELLVAYLINEKRIDTEIEKAVIELFNFLAHSSNMVVTFPNAIGNVPTYSPIIADPTNNENNTLERISQHDWKEITDKALNGFETISYATVVEEKGQTISLWKEVFGPHFNIEEE